MSANVCVLLYSFFDCQLLREKKKIKNKKNQKTTHEQIHSEKDQSITKSNATARIGITPILAQIVYARAVKAQA